MVGESPKRLARGLGIVVPKDVEFRSFSLKNVDRRVARQLDELSTDVHVEAAASGFASGVGNVVLLLTPDQLFVLDGKQVRAIDVGSVDHVSAQGISERDGFTLDWYHFTRADHGTFMNAVADRAGTHRVGEAPTPVDVSIHPDKVTTLQNLPGYKTIRALGVVSELSAASGFTAGSKGATALERAMSTLRVRAEDMGANAIVALSASAFGAGGGITSALGGDAVGVLLVGSAVTVEPAMPTVAGSDAQPGNVSGDRVDI
jgi:uncharacterized protein YbjQ (UPF0145 family)